jgi:hypothetical protein
VPCKKHHFARTLTLTVDPSAHSENAMKIGCLVLASAAVALVAINPALARKRHHRAAVPPQCQDRPYAFSLGGLLTNGAPQPNGCAPAVHEYGYYVGQDPDPNIRLQLLRDPATGYPAGHL